MISPQLVIDNVYMSRPAIEFLLTSVHWRDMWMDKQAEGEIDNFRNLLQNLLERFDESKTWKL